MKFFVLSSLDPYLNLAVEQYLFSTTTEDVFMLWQNAPTVVVGKNQNVFAEINFDYLKENGIKVARRITGGGAVYHDLGNVNYTFISVMRNSGIDFEYFTAPIIEALRSLGVNAELSGRNDLIVNGKKISGNAQYSHSGRVLHHGTLLFDSDISVLSSVLNVDEEKIKTKAVRSVSSRVTNLKEYLNRDCNVQEFISLIADYIRKRYAPTEEKLIINEEIVRLAERNSTSEWLYPERKLLNEYSLIKKRRYSFGTVCIYIKMHGKKAEDVKVCGDFFGIAPIEELEREILSCYPDGVDNIEMPVEKYIFGMNKNNLVELLKGDSI